MNALQNVLLTLLCLYAVIISTEIIKYEQGKNW